MSNKKFITKNGLLTTETQFVDTIGNSTQSITLTMDDLGTLSFSGTNGQLFSVTDNMEGTIFAVNDISGVPSIEVDDNGTIRFAELFGNILVGTATDNGTDKLQVAGNISVTGTVDGRDIATDGSKLDGIAASANNYTHPSTHPATMITTTDEFVYSSSTNVQDVLDDLDQALQGKQASGSYVTTTDNQALHNTDALRLSANQLYLYKGDGTSESVDLSLYLDDTNLARLVSGSLNGSTGIATFTRDDASTFTVDFSALFDDTNTNDYVDSISFNTGNGVLTLGRTGALADLTVDLDGRYAYSSHSHNYVSEGGTDFSGTYPMVARIGTNNIYSNPSLTYTGSTDTLNAVNIAVSGTVDGRDVSADGAKLDGIENNATADQTPAEILTAIKTVDGSGSGLDADLLDGLQASAFALASHTHSYDNYGGWTLYTDGTNRGNISSGEVVNIIGGTNVSLGYSSTNNAITINSSDQYTGTVTSVTGGSYLTGGTITGSGTLAVDASTASTANKVVARDSSGDINARLFRSEYDSTNSTINYIMTQVDTASNNYIRPSTPAQLASALSGSTMNINGSSTSCTGNSATATWADTVDVNSGNTSSSWYDVVWHSGDTVYSSTGVEIQGSTNSLRASNIEAKEKVKLGASQEANIEYNATSKSIDFNFA